MARQDFINQLHDLGNDVKDSGDKRVSITYIIPVGRFTDQKIELGFEVADDFPVNPPAGPHISPQLFPMDGSKDPHPKGGVHASPFGSEWQYLSRPFPDWGRTDHSVRAYLAHIRHLFETS
jgi:hypothetical protein